MDDKQSAVDFTTPSGKYVVAIKKELGYFEWEEVQIILTEGITINPETRRPNPMPSSVALKANRKAAEYAILAIRDVKTDKPIPNPIEVLHRMDIEDGQAIMGEVAKTWQGLQLTKKNSIA